MKNLTDRISKLSPEQRALLEKQLSKKNLDISKLPSQKEMGIPLRNHNNPSPLSVDQERLWFFNQMNPDEPTYNVYGGIRLKGKLDTDKISRSVNMIVARHEAWRTTFHLIDGQPMQIVTPHLELDIPVVDLRHLPEAELESAARMEVQKEVQVPFDLEKGPILRVKIIRVRDEEFLCTFTIHHIVMDRVTFSILFYELMTNYKALLQGQEPNIPMPEIQYADFAEWQRTYLQGETKERLLDYWREKLANTDFVLNIATDYPRPPVQTYKGARHFFVIPREDHDRIKALGKREGASAFMIGMAMYKAMLFRYTGQADLLVGTPFANRNRKETERVVGYFLTNVIIRTQVDANMTYRELLKQVKDAALGAYANQDLPFGMLLDDVAPKRDMSRNPLYQASFVYVDVPEEKFELPGTDVSYEMMDAETAKYDITLALSEMDFGLEGFLEYSPSMFAPETIARMAQHLQNLILAVLENPEARIGDLVMMTEPEREQLLAWTETKRPLPEGLLVHELIEKQAAECPNDIALMFEDETMTYAELDARANQLAHRLQKQGIGPDRFVAIMMDRSLEMMVGLLGTLKAGGAYVPFDPNYPAERLSFMMEDTKASVVLTQSHLLDSVPANDAHVICLDTEWASIAQESKEQVQSGVQEHNLAYVIYTSGSTGKPKGAMLEHRSVCNSVLWIMNDYNFTREDRVVLRSPISFDASVWELFGMLMIGGRLVIAPQDVQQDILQLPAVIQKHGVTIVHMVPSLMQVLLQEGEIENCTTLQHVVLGGEAITLDLRDRFYAKMNAVLSNVYGPTEACVQSVAWKVKKEDNRATVPIGRPIWNTEIYILDAGGQIAPIGVPGEMHIGGMGLARGYLNREELTREKFIPNPFSAHEGDRLYKTGDLARWMADGTLEYMGRVDHQVKIRGLRIELGEIENALTKHPSIRQASVLAREDMGPGKHLVAYVVAHAGSVPDSTELRAFLKETLPEFMVPYAYVVLEAMPLLPNGKVNRHALPLPEGAYDALEEEFVAPRSEVEEVLAKIWCDLLGVKKVGVLTNFFELGGHSLLATQMVSRVREAFQVDVPIKLLFKISTVADLADVLLTHESKPGQVMATAKLRKKLDSMSPEQLQALLQAKRG